MGECGKKGVECGEGKEEREAWCWEGVGIAVDWVTQRWRFWRKHLRLMYSQATVRSYTKDRAVLRWDHTLKRGKV